MTETKTKKTETKISSAAPAVEKAEKVVSVKKVATPKVATVKKTAPSKTETKANGNVSNLKNLYKTEIVSALTKQFGYKNVNEVPKLEKVIINMGLGEVKDNSKSYNIAFEELALISGQKPVPTVAKKAISNFKLKEGMKIGAKVTLRGRTMYEFVERLISVALPRVRDFHGVNPKAFDGRGNFSFGIKEQLIFPEISYDKIEKIRGMDVCFVTTAKTNAEAMALLKAIGMPFRR